MATSIQVIQTNFEENLNEFIAFNILEAYNLFRNQSFIANYLIDAIKNMYGNDYTVIVTTDSNVSINCEIVEASHFQIGVFNIIVTYVGDE